MTNDTNHQSPVSVPEGDAREIAQKLVDELAQEHFAYTATTGVTEDVIDEDGVALITAALLSAESRAARQMQERVLMALGALSDADRTSTWNLAIREAVKIVAALPLSSPEEG